MRDNSKIFISANPRMRTLAASPVVGGYTHLDGTKVTEISYMIKGSNYLELFDAVYDASFPEEESILEIDGATNKAWLIFKDGSQQYLGVFTEVDGDEARSSAGYTIIDGKYFTAKGA